MWGTSEFYGIVPRLSDRQRRPTIAREAVDVDLTHGTLRPFREPAVVDSVAAGSKQLVSWMCCNFGFPACVTTARWMSDCPRLFVTGRSIYPEVATMGDNCTLTYSRLGVPKPRSAPIVSASSNPTQDNLRHVAYAVTYVNNFSEEGAPSPASSDVVIADGQSVTIQLDYDPSPEYGVDRIRLYRRESGFTTGAEREVNQQTEYFLVAELPIDAVTIADTTRVKDVGYALTTHQNRPPPVELEGVIALDDTSILAGFIKNKLYFSENLTPHSWPVSEELTLDDNIVALASYAGNLMVMTDGHAYIVESDAGCAALSCRRITRVNEPMPYIACHSGRGHAVTPFGVVYSSADGLVLFGDATPIVISSSEYSASDWRLLEPHLMRMEYHKGALYCVSDSTAFIMWLDSETYKDVQYKRLVTLSDRPVDLVETRSGELLMLFPSGQVKHWNAGVAKRPYTWSSGDIFSGFFASITRVRVTQVGGRVQASLTGAYGEAVRSFLPGDNVIPFGRLGRHKRHNLTLTGTGEVTGVEVGVSSNDMSRGAT